MDCPCLEAFNWPLTLPGYLLSTGMALRGGGAGDRDGVVLEAARRRKERTYPEPVHRRHNRVRLVVLAAEVEAGGLMKRGASSELWPWHVPDLNPGCCANELNNLGECDGGHCSPVLPHGHSPPLLELRSACGADGELPETFDVETDFPHVGLD